MPGPNYGGAINVQLIAGATFNKGDLYKFIAINSSGHAVIGPSTISGNIFGILNSVTASTLDAGVEPVAVSLLVGKTPLRMAGSTLSAGNLVAASSNGYGTAATTDAAALGVIVDGSSGSTGRIVTVAWVAAAAASV
jgi:hypothetical protein